MYVGNNSVEQFSSIRSCVMACLLVVTLLLNAQLIQVVLLV